MPFDASMAGQNPYEIPEEYVEGSNYGPDMDQLQRHAKEYGFIGAEPSFAERVFTRAGMTPKAGPLPWVMSPITYPMAAGAEFVDRGLENLGYQRPIFDPSASAIEQGFWGMTPGDVASQVYPATAGRLFKILSQMKLPFGKTGMTQPVRGVLGQKRIKGPFGERPGFNLGEPSVLESRSPVGAADIPSWDIAASTEAPGGRAATGALPQGRQAGKSIHLQEAEDTAKQLQEMIEKLGGKYTNPPRPISGGAPIERVLPKDIPSAILDYMVKETTTFHTDNPIVKEAKTRRWRTFIDDWNKADDTTKRIVELEFKLMQKNKGISGGGQ